MAFGDRGLKGGMKAADKSGTRYTLVIGDDEISSNKCQLKLMSEGTVISSTLSVTEILQKLESN
jgi:histidyl-tRNA synthetase